MSSFTFVHAADLHLDTPFVGMHRLPDPIRKTVRESTFMAFDHLIELCINEKADFLVIAGDVYDAADRSLRAQLYFKAGMERLATHGIFVYVVHGNHDPDDGQQARLNWPEHVVFFPAGEVASAVFCKDGMEAARIYGISYPSARIEDNYASRFKRADELYAIGLLHTNVDGNEGHANYAPCAKQDLVSSGFDYWALGHVHTRAVLHEASPSIVYPGNIQGRSVRETGERGCYVVRVTGKQTDLTFRSLEAVRWQETSLDAGGCESEQELMDRLELHKQTIREAAGGKPVLVRLLLTGQTSLHTFLKNNDRLAELREIVNQGEEQRSDFVFVDSVIRQTSMPIDRERLVQEDDLLGDYLRMARAIGDDDEKWQQLYSGALTGLLEHYQVKKHMTLTDSEVKDWIKEAEDLAIDLLAVTKGDTDEN
ncbi:metallophosphoesterase family protein [Aneurinibacillus terranovensis]|uniref:metallophosphoesterase family protein n=1 Tax=Aneurinibacillus terranovensis TaxID=278991 RepID=UPI00047FF82F|nr:DNA repair exonuclease [Aneurinibacillus terranovensis]